MAKPIVVMYLPPDFEDSGWQADKIMSILNNFPDKEEKYVSTDYWKDYYWFCFYKQDIDAPELKVFYDKDFTPINFEELKAFIDNHIKT